jgi:hypothetical protein
MLNYVASRRDNQKRLRGLESFRVLSKWFKPFPPALHTPCSRQTTILSTLHFLSLFTFYVNFLLQCKPILQKHYVELNYLFCIPLPKVVIGSPHPRGPGGIKR